MLSSFLAEKASTSSPIVLNYSFHCSLDYKSPKVLPFVLSLLFQLCSNKKVTSNPLFQETVEKFTTFIEHGKQSIDCPFKPLLDILDGIFKRLQEFHLIIDGLDACVEQDNTWDISKYVRDVGKRPNSRVVILSRASTRLEAVFAGVTQISMDCVEILQDIEHYLQRRIDRTPRLQSLRGEIIQKSRGDGRGMFLWAKLMLDGLQSCLGTIRGIRDTLSKTPAQLFDLYEQQIETHCWTFCPSVPFQHKRDEALLLLLGLNQPLSVQEISAALALDIKTNLSHEEDELVEPAAEIEMLCRPLVTVVGDFPQFIHVSAREFLLERKTAKQSADIFLARKSLSKLSQAQYKDWKYAANLLERNLLGGSVIGDPLERPLKESVFYNYACLHWYEHVTALSEPPDDVVDTLSNLLCGTEFVTWSEVLFDLKGRIGLGPVIEVRIILLNWFQGLAPPIKARLPFDQFFVGPHERLSSELEQKSEKGILLYLPLIRLGAYFNLGAQSSADWEKAYNYKKTVADGFENILGAKDLLTLRVKTSMLQEFFWQKRFPEAERGLREVAKLQQEILGDKNIDYWVTLQLLGLAHFSLANFEEARSTLRQTEDGLAKLVGSSNILFLMTGLYKGYVHERLAELEQAFQLYDGIWKEWIPVMGQSNPFSLMLQTAIGSVSRKQKQYDLSQKSLLEAWAVRQRIFSIHNNVCLDSAIQLALTYRESGYHAEARDYLDVVSKSEVLDTDFERYCQVTHIRALLDIDAGDYVEPRLSLETLLASERNRNNRELLWVRIDLADLLREHGEQDEAQMLFSELVESTDQQEASRHGSSADQVPLFLLGGESLQGQLSSDDDPVLQYALLEDEPEPIDQLLIAEKALRLVRAAQPVAAKKLLLQHDLRWIREEDFWILQGGPITDTA